MIVTRTRQRSRAASRVWLSPAVLLLVLSGSTTGALRQVAQLKNSGRPQLRVATYNIRSCEALDSRFDCERIARVLRSTTADVIALEEVRADQAAEMARALGFYFIFARADRVHGYVFGNAILSRFLIRQTRIYSIGVPGRQQRACVRADIAWPDDAHTIHVFAVHFGLSKAERKTQTLHMVSPEILADPALEHTPQILMGDFNEKSPNGFVNQHISALLQPIVKPSWPGFLPIMYLDRIYCNGAWKVRSAHLSASFAALIASDHAPVVAVLEQIPTSRNYGFRQATCCTKGTASQAAEKLGLRVGRGFIPGTNAVQ
jgi:endonuclease/exonuclease/phosphatase family metal-dependent hydrolase